ncbi:MAG TPA: hypothetical protein VFX22_07925, partial [Candidatus Kapabacteria bacterium]|nr:hypothetical protein [Candidatus Kapabacteria bacterium]
MNLFRNTLITGLFILILAGCNASTSPSGTTTTPGSMVATVNGSAWSSTVVPLGVTGGATGKFNFPSTGNLTITGIASDLTEITIEIYHPHLGTDTMVLSGDLGIYSQGVPDTSKDYVTIPTFTNPVTGTVTLTAYDTTKKQASGSFNFVARKAHNLSDSVIV